MGKTHQCCYWSKAKLMGRWGRRLEFLGASFGEIGDRPAKKLQRRRELERKGDFCGIN